MTVQTNTNVASFNGNGVTQIFPIAFKFNNDADLVVLLVDDHTGVSSLLTLNSDYTVSGEGDEEGGLINVAVAPAVGQRLKVSRIVDILQLLDLRNQGKFFAEVHEDAFDLLTMIAQQHDSAIRASIRVAESDAEPARLPSAASRANQVLAFDAIGNPITVIPASGSAADLAILLANSSDPSKGAGLVGFKGGTVGGRLAALESQDDAGKGAALIGYRGTSVTSALDGVRADLGSVAAGSADALAGDLSDPAAVVASINRTNLANPAIADPALASTAAQLHRLYNSDGSLSAQSPTALGTFAVTRRYQVVAGSTYTVSMHGAPLDFLFYFTGSAFIGFYNADGTFHSQITTGFTRSNGDRQVTFTVPAGATRVAFNLRNFREFSNANPMSEASLQSALNNIMLNTGSTALTFAPYTTGSYSPSVDMFNPKKSGSTVVAIQGEYLYVRTACQQSAETDVVWRIRFKHGLNYNRVDSRSGVVDFYGVRFISRSVDPGSTIAAFNQSSAIHCAGVDESAPEKLNGMFLGGGHGVTSWTVTKVAHGMTAVDVGSVWSDGLDQWVLTYIESDDKIVFVRKYTGTESAWTITSSPPSSATFTHVSGATNIGNIAFNSPTLSQFVPIIRQFLWRISLDGKSISDDGFYVGDQVVLSEIYSILSPASQQDFLRSTAGSSSPDYVNSSVLEQVRVFNEYSWNKWGAMSVRAGRGIKQGYTRSAGIPGDYWGVIQLQRLTLNTDSTPGPNASVHLYAPDVVPVGGYDLKAVADITANADVVQIMRTDCLDPADPVSHWCQFGKGVGGATISGHLYGFSREEGLGIPAVRASSANVSMYFSSAEKQYPIAIDVGAGNADSESTIVATAFRAPFLPTDLDLTVPAVIATMSGKHYCYVTAHKTLSRKLVKVPSDLNGLPITVVKGHANVTVHSSYVTDGEIVLSVVGGYGDIVLRIG